MSDTVYSCHRGKPKAVHFGAGNIGRGFIGALLFESGYHVVFSDVDKHVVDELNALQTYKVHILDEREHTEVIGHFNGVVSHDDEVIAELAHPHTHIITTAVGVAILSKIAPTIAKGLKERRAQNGGPINIVGCENMVRQTDALAEHVRSHLSDDERAWVDAHVGFANCSVDRIVPGAATPDADHPLDVGVEDFSEWVVDKTQLRAPVEPPIARMVLTDNLDAYIERKLFTLNCGHAIAAYLGFLRGKDTIDAAVADPEIAKAVRGALEEGGAALVKRHGFEKDAHARYIDKIMARFANPKLSDAVERVGKQPLRKLGRKDRLLGPAYMAREYGLPIDHLARGIAAVFLFDVDADEQSRELMGMVKAKGVEKAVEDVTGFKEGDEAHTKIIDAYAQLKEQRRSDA
ncbi:mannitol-1-phosphate 5-dehydrogenase [Amylostereum chailletii]|nr:mannitol-1-phosphate 5-dehydrogenase [Amylostereum chailletii]